MNPSYNPKMSLLSSILRLWLMILCFSFFTFGHLISTAQDWPIGITNLQINDRAIGSVVEFQERYYDGQPDMEYYSNSHHREKVLEKIYYPEGDSMRLYIYSQWIEMNGGYYSTNNHDSYYDIYGNSYVWETYYNLSDSIFIDTISYLSPSSINYYNLLFEYDVVDSSELIIAGIDTTYLGIPTWKISAQAVCSSGGDYAIDMETAYIEGVGKFYDHNLYNCFEEYHEAAKYILNYDADGADLQGFMPQFDDLKNIPTIAEVYNYDIGDEFIFLHFDTLVNQFIITQKTITDYSSNADSIWYNYELNEYVMYDQYIMNVTNFSKFRTIYNPSRYYYRDVNDLFSSYVKKICYEYHTTNEGTMLTDWVLRGNSICEEVENVMLTLAYAVWHNGPPAMEYRLVENMVEGIPGVGITVNVFPENVGLRNVEKEYYGNLVYVKKQSIECG